MTPRRIGHWFVYLAVRIAVCVVQALRIETCQSLSRGISFLAQDVLRIRADIVDQNLRYAFPGWSARQRRQTARKMWEHLILLFCEMAHVPRKLHDTNWREHIHFSGDSRRQFVRLLLDPRPVTIVSGHFGNFEIGNYVLGMLGFPSFAIARPLDNPYLERFVKRFRRATGQQILPTHGSAQQIASILKDGHTLAMLGDQHAGWKGCFVDFFDRPASCHKAIAVFPLTSNGPLAVCYVKRGDRPMQFELGVAGVADPRVGGDHLAGIQELTQWYNHQLERLIRDAPDQYWWLHRRWKGHPRRTRHGPRQPASDRPARRPRAA